MGHARRPPPRSCNPPIMSVLLQPSHNVYKYGRLGCRTAYNSRKGARNGFQADPLENIRIENGPLHASKLFKPFVFTIGVSAASLAGCVIWEYESLRYHANNLLRRPGAWLSAQQRRLLAQSKSDPGPARKWWSSLKDSEKVFYPILAANVLSGAIMSVLSYVCLQYPDTRLSIIFLPMFWCNWGHSQIWGNKDKFLQYYHVLRKNDPGR
ncbi:hypothetical protein MSG28_000331 [Choristoneura fumiferana]|nr:hypothetical protein MSG28_000331 [Choristoneura fumiferana]